MEMWELCACFRAYKTIQKRRSDERVILAWNIANFVGAAFSGKLRKLDYYLNQEQVTAPSISKEEFEEKLKLAREEVEKCH